MSVQITDCTIRDGGYLLNKNSDPTFVKAVLQGLADADIDFVETGFLQNQVNGESLVYHDSKDIRRYLPERKGHTEFLGFCDNSRYSLKKLDEYDGRSFHWLRISFAQHELGSALDFCAGVQAKGYIVQFNPMDILSYTEEEIEAMVGQVNAIRPGSLSIVDTFGAMYLEDLARIFDQFDRSLDKDIKIGLHSHDNLGLSTALAETMIMLSERSGRDVIVDGSLMGMGRGAGNASTELLAGYLNQRHSAHYDIKMLLDVIEKWIVPLREHTKWGYDPAMMICGAMHAHVDNVFYLRNHTNCTARQMYEVIGAMTPEQRIRYGKGYSKTDFSVLSEMYEGLKNQWQ